MENKNYKLRNGNLVYAIQEGIDGVIIVQSSNGNYSHQTLNSATTGKCYRNSDYDIMDYSNDEVINKLEKIVKELQSELDKVKTLEAIVYNKGSKLRQTIFFIVRLLTSPIILMLILVSYFKSVITLFAFYIVYGGEFMVYKKEKQLDVVTFGAIIEKALKSNK